MRNKILSLLVLLLTVAAGAWAQDQYPIVYDFEAAADAGENPASKNGSLANGQAFYGWEDADEPKNQDVRRQDYKGYEYTEGSVLPEVCHVWRRSDHINGNVAGNGGLKCPSNKEMAIDGLDVGYKVTIIYDATNAAEGKKEIVWAIGDGYSDATLDKPRATATINGAEAVPGQTTIESGDVITVSSVTPAENGTGYIVFAVKKGMVIKKIIVEAPTLVEGFSWDAATKTGTINQMPAGNVTVFVNYYAQAKAADGAVTAAEDAQATTDAPLVTIDETKLTGASGLMYFVSETETAPDYDAQGWTDQVPNAKDYTEEKTLYVWYYPIGADGTTGTNIYSDGDMNARALPVNVLPEPTYNVEFAEDTDPNEWTASPNTDVKKGQTVTVTYSGTRKVIGVKAEKKAAPKLLEFEPRPGVKFYYYEGETWGEAINNHPENKTNGWSIDEDENVMNNGQELHETDNDDKIKSDMQVNPNIGYIW